MTFSHAHRFKFYILICCIVIPVVYVCVKIKPPKTRNYENNSITKSYAISQHIKGRGDQKEHFKPDASDEAQNYSLSEETDESKYTNGYQNMTNVGFLNYLRTHWIKDPPIKQIPIQRGIYHLSQCGQSELVDRILDKRRNGFFVEAGAATGQRLSNSFFFEKQRNWTGLLVEPNPDTFYTLSQNHRNAYLANTCLGVAGKTEVVKFRQHPLKGSIVQDSNDDNWTVFAQCIPLYGMLQALGITHVDYFSLDIEGLELEVLQTFPFDKITIDVLTIEYYINNHPVGTVEKLNNIRAFFKELGNYEEIEILFNSDQWKETDNQTLAEAHGLDVVFHRMSP